LIEVVVASIPLRCRANKSISSVFYLHILCLVWPDISLIQQQTLERLVIRLNFPSALNVMFSKARKKYKKHFLTKTIPYVCIWKTTDFKKDGEIDLPLKWRMYLDQSEEIPQDCLPIFPTRIAGVYLNHSMLLQF
jgi:hypothetical protein